MNSELNRRVLLGLACALVATPIFAETSVQLIASKRLSVEDAYDLAESGDITLIDIRRPDEWAATGVGQGAQPLDMRRKDFLRALDEIVVGDRSKPVALICARGVRSKWLSAQLATAGFTNIIDVPEGMLGSHAGPGWVRIGLPVVR